jgi:hypothetical protein
VCKVALCKTAKDKSHKKMNCFYIWHNSVDLIIEHNKIKQAYKKCNTTKNNATRETSSEDEVDDDDESHEGLKNCTLIGNLKNDNDEERGSSGEASKGEEYRTSTLEI